MKILYLQHGLGNQIFQYAYIKYLESKIHASIYIDSSAPSLRRHHGIEIKDVFPLLKQSSQFVPYVVGRPLHIACDMLKRVTGIALESNNEAESENDAKRNSILWLRGYWQDSCYADAVESDLRRDLRFADFETGDNLNRSLAQQITAVDSANTRAVNSVSLHIRRGDYVSPEFKTGYSGICTDQYYRKAIEHILDNVENPLFFVFSDDIEWAKENLGIDNAVYISHNCGRSSFRDMQLMSLCRHNIIANSSFSWWGAWLNSNPDKIVIAPAKWFNFTSAEFDRRITPQNWVRF